MAKVTNIKRIIKDNFQQKDQELVEALAFSINPFSEQIVAAFDKGINFDNLNQELLTFKTRVNAQQVPIVKLDIKTTLKTRIQGCTIINVQNITDASLLTSAPFISYNLSQSGITITQILGIVPNKDYNITVILIG
jgi:hypothetical protein